MNALAAFRSIAQRFRGMELPAGSTAVMLHWPHRLGADAVFQYRGIYHGEQLHQLLDALLDEHAVPTYGETVLTEISVFRHYPNGWWETEEHRSHSAAP